MKSLLILGFKRSMSSAVYKFYERAIPALKKSGVSDGEVINRNHALASKYKHPHHATSDEKYLLHKEVLDSYKEGYLIKEVTQPYTIVRYLKENPGAFNVVYMDRNLDYIEFACKKKTWDGLSGWKIPPYPELCRMREEMMSVADGIINVDKALKNHKHIFNVVRQLGYKVNGWNYLDKSFQNRTKAFYTRFEKQKNKMYKERQKEVAEFNKKS